MSYGTWNSVLTGASYSATKNPLGVVGPTVTTTGTVLTVTTSRGGTLTPGFRRDKSGRLKQTFRAMPMNDFSFRRTVNNVATGSLLYAEYGVGPPGFYLTAYSGRIGLVWGMNAPIPPALSSGEKTSVDWKATKKVLSKLQDMKVNLGQVYAERKRTADLISTNFIRMSGAAAMLRKGNFQGAARYLNVSLSRNVNGRLRQQYRTSRADSLSSGWLEIQYGWLPLCSDIVGMAETLAQSQIREIRNRVAARDFRTQSRKTSFVSTFSYSDDEFTRYEVSYVLYYATENLALQSLSKAGIANIATVVWEVTPWSFVVDWALPIGSWIQALGASLGYSLEKGCKTIYEKRTVTRTSFASNVPYASGTIRNARGIAAQEIVNVDRYKLLTFPSLPFPSFENPYSFVRALNAIALLSQTLKR